LLVALHLRVRYVERVLSAGDRTLGEVRRVRVAGTLTWVTCDLPDRGGVTLAYVTRNIDLDRLQPGRVVGIAHLPRRPTHAVVLDLFAPT
jgi:hypothetical protein